MTIRPMLAPSESAHKIIDLAAAFGASDLKFPIIAQPKFDGFRCIIHGGVPMTRTLKPISNSYVRYRLENTFGTSIDISGMDGELIALDPVSLEELDLHRTQSAINKASGFPRFVYHVFDDFTSPDLPYVQRQKNLNLRLERIRNHVSIAKLETNPERISKRIHSHVFQSVESRFCERIEDVLQFENECLAWGAEGIMLRDPGGRYKFGRATFREGLLYKVKRFTDDEATIIGFIELMINENSAEIDERGYTKRSSAKDNLVPGGTLGAIICDWKGIQFEIGTFKGWSDADKQEVWDNRHTYLGMRINFKYKGVGPNGKPLIPSGQGIRYDV